MKKIILKTVIFSVLTVVFTLLIVNAYGHIEYYTFFYDWSVKGLSPTGLIFMPKWYLVAETDELKVIVSSIIIVLGLGIGSSLLYIKNLNNKKLLLISITILYIILILWHAWIAFSLARGLFEIEVIYICLPPYREYSFNDAIHDMDFWITIFNLTCYYILWHISLIHLLKNINKLKTYK